MAQQLTCRIDRSLPTSVIQLTGVMDLCNAPAVRGAVRACVRAGSTSVVIDLTGVVTATALAVALVAAMSRRLEGWPGVRIMVAGPDGRVSQLVGRLRDGPVGRHLAVYPSVTAALAAVRAELPRREHTERLPPALESPARARDMVRRFCRRNGLTGPAAVAELIASELVSNAVLHAGTSFEFAVRLHAGTLCVSVRDATRTMPRLRRLPEPAEHGRGLPLIDALSARWGRAVVPGGKIVWACLRATGGVARPAATG